MSLANGALSEIPVPTSRELACWQVEPTIAAPRAVRHDVLARWGDTDSEQSADPVAISRLALVLTELVTNAVQHGEDSIRVTLGRTSVGWLVAVTEHPPPLAREAERPTSWRSTTPGADLGGRGLTIVAAISTRCGWTRPDGHLVIWAEVPDHPDPAESDVAATAS